MFIKIKNKIGVIILCLCSACVLLESITLAAKTHKEEIAKSVAVKIIISEAADQGLVGMICVGEVLRQRGSIKGFYGYKSNRIVKQSKEVEAMAAKAWELSARTNYTKGADHFENIHEFGEPWWAKYCVKTYAYKDHVFYKEKRSLNKE